MTKSRYASLQSGIQGRFWPIQKDSPPSGPVDDDDAVIGQLQLVDGLIRVQTQTPPAQASDIFSDALTKMAEGAEPAPRWLFGLTELGPVIVPLVSRDSASLGTYTSTRTFYGSAVAVDVAEPFGPRLTRLAVRLPHADWADLNPMKSTGHFDAEHRWSGLDIELRGTGPLDGGRVGSIALSLYGTWNQLDQDEEHRTLIQTGLEVRTESRTPREHTDHIEVAMSVQDLIGLAYDRFEPALSAAATLEGDTSQYTDTWFYHRDLVESAGLKREARRNKAPLFKLNDLGDATAIARWVVLNRACPDAANAISVRHRAPFNPTRRIIELGAAIEQYVASFVGQARKAGRKPPAWTQATGGYESALARHGGTTFAQFVGDPVRWGALFHQAYIAEKHYVGTRRPAAELVQLCSSSTLR